MHCTKERCRPVNVFDELDRGLNQFVRGVLSAETQAKCSPPVTRFETADRYRMECDMPGVALDDISVSVENYVLTISGQRKKAGPSITITLQIRSPAFFRSRASTWIRSTSERPKRTARKTVRDRGSAAGRSYQLWRKRMPRSDFESPGHDHSGLDESENRRSTP